MPLTGRTQAVLTDPWIDVDQARSSALPRPGRRGRTAPPSPHVLKNEEKEEERADGNERPRHPDHLSGAHWPPHRVRPRVRAGQGKLGRLDRHGSGSASGSDTRPASSSCAERPRRAGLLAGWALAGGVAGALCARRVRADRWSPAGRCLRHAQPGEVGTGAVDRLQLRGYATASRAGASRPRGEVGPIGAMEERLAHVARAIGATID